MAIQMSPVGALRIHIDPEGEGVHACSPLSNLHVYWFLLSIVSHSSSRASSFSYKFNHINLLYSFKNTYMRAGVRQHARGTAGRRGPARHVTASRQESARTAGQLPNPVPALAGASNAAAGCAGQGQAFS